METQPSSRRETEQASPPPEKKTTFAYKIVRFLVWLFYPKTKVLGAEKLPKEPCILVANHAQMHGPIAGELYFPGYHYIWCAGEMMRWKDVPGYAFRDFWSQKPRWTHWFYRILSYLITPLAVCIFNNAHCIGVWRDSRILSTFRETLEKLKEGNSVIIFPEHDVPLNNIVYEFQERFIGIARTYYRRTGKTLSFVPLYFAPALKTMTVGTPLAYDPEADPQEEMHRLREELTRAVTELGRNLPEHTVVPYRNIPRKKWLSNHSSEVPEHEKTNR